MTSRNIVWTLLFLATVKARSEVSIAEAALDTEKSWSGVPVSKSEESSLKTDSNNQNNADLEEALLTRIGLDNLDALTHSGRRSDSENNLEKALNEKLRDLSDTLSRLSGMEPNDVPDTNYDNLVNLGKTDEVYQHQVNLKNDYVLNGVANEVDHLRRKDGRLNVLTRSKQNLNPVNADSEVLLTRLDELNSVKERNSNNLNNLLVTKNVLPNVVPRRNNVLVVPNPVLGRRVIGKHSLGKNDLDNVKIDADPGTTAIDEIISNGRSLVDLVKVNRNDLNNGVNELNKVNSLDDVLSNVNVLDNLSKHSKRKLSLNDLNQVKNALNSHESNVLNTRTGSIDVDRELASIIVNVRSGDNELNELNKLKSLDDASYDVNVFEHLNKHGSETNRNGLKKVSLNDLNDAKRLLGPLSLDKVVADRVSDEVDGALLHALSTEDDFNALGALLVLNKAAAADTSEKLNSVELNNLNSRSGSESANLNGNTLQEVLSRLAVLSKIASTDDVESNVNSEYNVENLSRSHENSLHNLVGSKVDAKLERDGAELEVDQADVDDLLNRISDRLSKKKLRKRPNKPKRPHKFYQGFRPSKKNNVPRYLYRSKLSEEENLSDLVQLSKLAKLRDLNDNVPVASVRNGENEHSLDHSLSTLGKSEVSDVTADLSEAQLKSLLALSDHALAHVHDRNHVNHLSDLDEEKTVRQAVAKLDKDLRDAKNLLLVGSLDNLKDQRRKVSGKSDLQLVGGAEENKYDNVVLVPVRLDSSAVPKRAGGPYDLSDLVDLDDVN